MRISRTFQLPHAERSGFEAALSEEERAIVETMHRFARDVMRPAAAALDRMTATDVISAQSALWTVYAKFVELGLDATMFDALEPAAAARLEALVMEELGWGDAGLAVSLAVASFPAQVAAASGKPELIELTRGKIGCWPITQPDRGCDFIDLYNVERHAGARPGSDNLIARFNDDGITISGQTSAWVSNGPVAQVAALCCPADYGTGVLRPDGIRNMAVIIVPLDLPGVSRGNALEKLGQLALPQGEIFFDSVTVPRGYAVASGEEGIAGFYSILAVAGTFMSQCFTGLARAAFEHALAYAHERKQGGVPIIQHQSVRWRLAAMYQKVEAARAMARRASYYLRAAPQPHPSVSSMSKAFVTQAAFEVADQAVQLFGGNGLTREYPVEKLFRDAKTALVEDGENFFLTLKLGQVLSDLHRTGWSQP